MKLPILFVPLFALAFAACDKTDKPTLSGSPTELKSKGIGNEIKGKFKQKWANLTDDDFLYAEGKRDEMVGRLQKKTGATKEDIEKMLE